jgi:hypothetical protein
MEKFEGSRLGAVTEERGEAVEDERGLLEGFTVGKAHDAVAKSEKIAVTIDVVGLLAISLVHFAVEFHHQAHLVAVEVRDVAADRYLTPKLEDLDLAISEQFPQRLFRWRGLSP